MQFIEIAIRSIEASEKRTAKQIENTIQLIGDAEKRTTYQIEKAEKRATKQIGQMIAHTDRVVDSLRSYTDAAEARVTERLAKLEGKQGRLLTCLAGLCGIGVSCDDCRRSFCIWVLAWYGGVGG